MTLQQLEYVVEVSRYNSISKAAQHLYMAQPSLSKAISNLEEELGITIFERTSRGIQFTPQGLEFLGGAKQLLEQANSLRKSLAASQEQKMVRLTVSSQHYSFATRAFTRFIRSCQENGDAYTLHMREGRTSQIIQDVYSHRSHLGVLSLSAASDRFLLRLLHERGLAFSPLATMVPHVFLSARHPLAGQETISLEALESYPYVSFEQGEDSLNFAEEVLAPSHTQRRILVMDRATMLSVLGETDGYNLGTGQLPQGGLSAQVVSRPVAGTHHSLRVGWIKDANRDLTPQMEQYIAFLREALDHPEED